MSLTNEEGGALSPLKFGALILNKQDRVKLSFISIVQILLGLMDLVALALVGFISALVIRGVQSTLPGERTMILLDFLGVGSWQFQAQVALLGTCTVVILIIKTTLSAYINQRILRFLAIRASALGLSVLKRSLNPASNLRGRYTQAEISHIINYGIPQITSGILGSVASIASDIFLTLVLFVGLCFIDVTTAVYALLFFGFVGYLIFKVMNKWAKQLGELQTDSLISGTQRIEQSIRNFRELYVQNKLNQLFDELEDIRNKYALRSANQLLIPNLNKYVLEISIAIGTFIMAAFQFSHNTAPIATANLAIFLVAGSRLAPAVMRVQHGLIQVKISMGEVSRTIRFVRHALNISEISDNYFPEEFRGTKFYPRVELRNLEFKYDDNHIFEVKIDELVVREGQSLAIVGKSGSGKTTLVDLMLGILSPKSGKILVSGLFPSQTFKLFPGLVSYVPQDIFLFRGSIAQNVSMEFDENNINYQRVKEALSSAQIEELASLSLDGLGLTIGEGGISLSGGQRQRIGIARALYSKPSLIFLDESTSALDAETEQRINDVISSLRGKATTITVAHRLSTVRNSDLVIYMENGKILGSGTFDELKESLPDFLQQTKLLGL